MKIFAPLLEENISEPDTLVEKVAYIILYDQIPRNIHRGTPAAYKYDSKSYALARRIFDTEMSRLPFHMKCTVLICLVHSEKIGDQNDIYDYIHSECMPQGAELVGTLRSIARNHRERIQMFGRFPERNKILGRKSTDAEAAFLAAIYA
jgi:uncharacterized protein (DUF924 family)